MAVGAERRRGLRLVLGDGLRLAVQAAALGLVAAAVLTRSMSQLLYGVGALDPLTLAGCAVTLVLVALWRAPHRPGAARASTRWWPCAPSDPHGDASIPPRAPSFPGSTAHSLVPRGERGRSGYRPAP